MKVGKIVNPEFHKALMKLSNQDMPIEAAKKILLTLRKVKDITEKYHKERIKLLTDNSEKDDKGEVKLDDQENFIIEKDKQVAVNEGLVKLMNKGVKLEKISVKELEEVRLSAQEFSLLEDLVSK